MNDLDERSREDKTQAQRADIMVETFELREPKPHRGDIMNTKKKNIIKRIALLLLNFTFTMQSKKY
jgi:uncharacterized protein YfdQ (DUF2303 family)